MGVMEEFLKREYKHWITETNREDTSDNVFEFLKLADGIKGYEDLEFVGVPTSGNRCILEIALYTDGDYHVSHSDMEDDGYWYIGIFEWNTDVEECRDKVIQLLREIRDNVGSHRKYVKEEVQDLFERAEKDILKFGCADVYLGGNYDGSSITFHNTIVGMGD